MIKKFTSLVLLTFFMSGLASAESAYSINWDPDLAPTTRQSLTAVITRNSGNAVTLFKMLEKSKMNRLGAVALKTVGALCQKYPEQPAALAAYCWGYANQIDMLYVPKEFSGYRERTADEEALFKQRFKKCKELAPRHWLLLLTEGHKAYAGPSNSLSPNYGVAIAKFKQAYEASPKDKYVRSTCLSKQASVYNLAAMNKYIYRDKPVSFQDAVTLFEQAGRLDGRASGIWLTLYLIYRNDLNDPQNARRVGQLFLNTLPPDYKAKWSWAKTVTQELQKPK